MTQAITRIRTAGPAALLAALAFAAPSQAQDKTQDKTQSETSARAAALDATPIGTWVTQGGRSRVRIFRCGDKLCGRIVWLREPALKDGTKLVDKLNPDPKLRDRPVVGLTVIWDFSKSDRPGRWSGGGMYHPEEGKYYKGALTLRPDGRLRVRGYRKVPIIGKTQYWTRVKPDTAE